MLFATEVSKKLAEEAYYLEWGAFKSELIKIPRFDLQRLFFHFDPLNDTAWHWSETLFPSMFSLPYNKILQYCNRMHQAACLYSIVSWTPLNILCSVKIKSSSLLTSWVSTPSWNTDFLIPLHLLSYTVSSGVHLMKSVLPHLHFWTAAENLCFSVIWRYILEIYNFPSTQVEYCIYSIYFSF